MLIKIQLLRHLLLQKFPKIPECWFIQPELISVPMYVLLDVKMTIAGAKVLCP